MVESKGAMAVQHLQGSLQQLDKVVMLAQLNNYDAGEQEQVARVVLHSQHSCIQLHTSQQKRLALTAELMSYVTVTTACAVTCPSVVTCQ